MPIAALPIMVLIFPSHAAFTLELRAVTMPISRAGVETQAYLPTGRGRLRVQNDIKERNAKRRGSLDEAQKARRGNTYVYTSAPGDATKTVRCDRRLSLVRM
jgi:hypothetical protein